MDKDVSRFSYSVEYLCDVFVSSVPAWRTALQQLYAGKLFHMVQ